MRHCGPGSAGSVSCRTEAPKTAVFPLPVLDVTMTSLPSNMWGIALACTSVGSSNSNSFSAFSMGSDNPSSLKLMLMQISCHLLLEYVKFCIFYTKTISYCVFQCNTSGTFLNFYRGQFSIWGRFSTFLLGTCLKSGTLLNFSYTTHTAVLIQKWYNIKNQII